jgi:hypothetical protein
VDNHTNCEGHPKFCFAIFTLSALFTAGDNRGAKSQTKRDFLPHRNFEKRHGKLFFRRAMCSLHLFDWFWGHVNLINLPICIRSQTTNVTEASEINSL